MLHRNPSFPRALLVAGAARGLSVRAETDPNRILSDLTGAFSQFRERQDTRMSDVEASLDQLQLRVTAGALNGGGDLSGLRGQRRQAVEALGRFAKTGDPAAAFAGLNPQASMTSDSDPDGGYLVPDEVSSEIISLQRDISPMRRLARVKVTKSKAYQQPINKGGSTSGWVEERESRTETETPDLAMLEFPAGEIYANPAVTQNLLDDSDFDLGEFLATEISNEFDDQEGAAFITGNGIKKPRGILSYDTYVGAGNAEFHKIQAVHSGAATDFSAANPFQALVDVRQALKAKHRRNAVWIMNSATQGKVSKWVDGQGRPIWQTALTAGAPDMLLGHPVELDENMPDVGAGAYPVALGNWKLGYLINDRMGIRILRDPYTNKPKVHFYATKRVGGGLLDAEAIKLLKIAA